MKRDDLWFYTFCGFVTLAVGYAVLGDLRTTLCDGVDLARLAEGKPAFGCVEFWFNRYQTTVQTIVSGAIGAAGLFFILRQLKELSKQNEFTQDSLRISQQIQMEEIRRNRANAAHAIENYAETSRFLINAYTLTHFGDLEQSDAEYERSRQLPPTNIIEPILTDDERAEWHSIQIEMGEQRQKYLNYRGEVLTSLKNQSKLEYSIDRVSAAEEIRFVFKRLLILAQSVRAS